MRLIAALLSGVALAACAHAPVFRLAPAELGQPLSLMQQIVLSRGEQSIVMDAQVEIDEVATRVALVAGGRRVMRLVDDGLQMHSEVAPELATHLDPVRILSALQFVYWPADRLRARLVPPWQLADAGHTRTLLRADTPVARVTYSASPRWQGRADFVQLDEGYRMRIDSAVMP